MRVVSKAHHTLSHLATNLRIFNFAIQNAKFNPHEIYSNSTHRYHIFHAMLQCRYNLRVDTIQGRVLFCLSETLAVTIQACSAQATTFSLDQFDAASKVRFFADSSTSATIINGRIGSHFHI